MITNTNFQCVFIKFLGCLVGCIVNMLIVLAIYYIGVAMQGNETLDLMLGSFLAYPLAKIASKYTKKGLKKAWGMV